MSVIFVNNLPWTLVIDDQMTDFGECDSNFRHIRVKSDQTREQLAVTILHELIHCCWYLSDLDDHTVANLEETVASRLGEMLGGVLLDPRNQSVFAEILRE